MEILKAVLLGIVEGLTEFLPISSTGHLILAEEYINFKDTAKTFTVAIQMGAILAVIWYYRRDIKQKLSGVVKGDNKAKRFLTGLLMASIPAGLLGLALNDKFDEIATPEVVAFALIAGAIVLWLVDRRKPAGDSSAKVPALESITPKQAILIGLAQCFALIPGISRSGASIVGGLLTGLNRVTATAFSFYLAIPILGAAGIYKLVTGGGELSTISGGLTSLIVGTAISFIVALLSISWLLKYVSSHSFKLFVYYRIILGIAVLIILA